MNLLTSWCRVRAAWRLLAVLIALCGLLSPAAAFAQPVLESEVKAAYLYRFLDFVTWPQQAFRGDDEPLAIGFVDAGDIASEFARLTRERTVQGRPLRAVQLQNAAETPVHVLYVPQAARAKLPRILEQVRGRPVLVVTDMPDGLEKGAVINFVAVGNRLHFEVSIAAASKSELVISSRLLAVALRVKKGEYATRHFATNRRADSEPPG